MSLNEDYLRPEGDKPPDEPAPAWAKFLTCLVLTMISTLLVLLFIVALLRILRWL